MDEKIIKRLLEKILKRLKLVNDGLLLSELFLAIQMVNFCMAPVCSPLICLHILPELLDLIVSADQKRNIPLHQLLEKERKWLILS